MIRHDQRRRSLALRCEVETDGLFEKVYELRDQFQSLFGMRSSMAASSVSNMT